MNRRRKLLVALLVIATAAVFVVWNTGLRPVSSALGVSEAKLRASGLEGEEVAVRGTVVEGSIVQAEGRVVEFVVADQAEHLRVEFNRTPPDNFGAKEVVLKGFLHVAGDLPYMEATAVQVGCASKY